MFLLIFQVIFATPLKRGSIQKILSTNGITIPSLEPQLMLWKYMVWIYVQTMALTVLNAMFLWQS
jgi:hypothetical protein